MLMLILFSFYYIFILVYTIINDCRLRRFNMYMENLNQGQ